MPLIAPASGWGTLVARAVEQMAQQVRPEEASWVAPDAVDRLGALLDLVVLWNQRLDLTAARSSEELVDLFVADAVVLAVHARTEGERWVDVGSGGGAPGLALCMLVSDLSLTLVEPRSKRVAFLRSALGTIGATSVAVERARSEQLPAASWEVACSRATLPPPQWLAEGARLATRAVWVLLARAEVPVLDGWHRDRELVYHWPLTGVGRRAVRFVPERGEDAP